MQKVLLSTQTGILTVALLIACPLLNSRTDAMSVRQVIMKTQPISTVPGTTHQVAHSKTAALARNTNHEATAKAEKADVVLTAKPQQPKGKTTVGRCWKQLMSNLREIRHAHKKH